MSTTPSVSASIPRCASIVGGRAMDATAASTSEMARFETETLSTRENLKHLMVLPGTWIDQAHRHRTLTKLILDMDSSVSEAYGQQEGTAYNGYFECTCYHPLFLFNQFGDLERTMLRRGNHASAKFWRRVLLPVIERYRDRDIPKFFRGDSAFALPKLFALLEREGFRYAIRLKSNAVLDNTLIVWMSDSGEGHHGFCGEWPLVLVGGMAGKLKTAGRFLQFPTYKEEAKETANRIVRNFYLALLHAVGDRRENFGELDKKMPASAQAGPLAAILA